MRDNPLRHMADCQDRTPDQTARGQVIEDVVKKGSPRHEGKRLRHV